MKVQEKSLNFYDVAVCDNAIFFTINVYLSRYAVVSVVNKCTFHKSFWVWFFRTTAVTKFQGNRVSGGYVN